MLRYTSNTSRLTAHAGARSSPEPSDATWARALLRELLLPLPAQEDEQEDGPPGRDEYLRMRKVASNRKPPEPPPHADVAEWKGRMAQLAAANAAAWEARVAELVPRARKGDRDAYISLRWMACSSVACDAPLHPLLLEYMVVDAPEFRRCGGRPARRGDDKIAMRIANAVAVLVRLTGLPIHRPGKPDPAAPPTVCSIVAEVLWDGARIPKTAGAIEKIYQHYYSPATRRSLRGVSTEKK
jgi:hypothetical protein